MNDLISRSDAIDAVSNMFAITPTQRDTVEDCLEILEDLPSAQSEAFEWCHDCKEYDQERHCCPRWNRVIRQTVEELNASQAEPKWNRLMMYLADLQLTYSPNWGANGYGDEKLYDFVTGLIEELEGWGKTDE